MMNIVKQIIQIEGVGNDLPKGKKNKYATNNKRSTPTVQSSSTISINKKINLYLPQRSPTSTQIRRKMNPQSKRLPYKMITADQIDDHAISHTKIMNQAITTEKLQDRSIIGEKLGYEIIATEHIQPEAIEAHHIKPTSITGAQIKPQSITADQIAEQTITAQKIANHTITSEKLMPGSIKGEHIQAETILGNHLHSGIIDTNHLINTSITPNKLAFTPIQASQNSQVIQQFGTSTYKLKKEQAKTDLSIQLEEGFASPDYIIVAMTNHPDCSVSLKSQKNKSATLTISRMDTTDKLSGSVMWIAIGKKNEKKA